jgi:hypothetical protein
MNAPVVVVEDLPAGPATAAIACLEGPRGPWVALAIRSQRSGQVVFFGPQEEPGEWQAPDFALDAALSFAESMGFLFEDDRLAAAPAEAWQLWEALLEAGGRARPPQSGDRSRATAESLAAPPELWLEEVVAAGPPIDRSLPLTKFRCAVAAPKRPRGRSAGGLASEPLRRFRVGGRSS